MPKPLPEAAELYLLLRSRDPEMTQKQALAEVDRSAGALDGWRKNESFRARELYLEESRLRDALSSSLKEEWDLAQREGRQAAFVSTRLSSRQDLYLESLRIEWDNRKAREVSGLTSGEVARMQQEDAAFKAGIAEILQEHKQDLYDSLLRQSLGSTDPKLLLKILEKIDEAFAPRLIVDHRGQITHTAQAAQERERWSQPQVVREIGTLSMSPQILTATLPPKTMSDDEEPS
jgi:hypothetical protein